MPLPRQFAGLRNAPDRSVYHGFNHRSSMTFRSPIPLCIMFAVVVTMFMPTLASAGTAPNTNLVIGTSRWVLFVPDETHANCSAEPIAATKSGRVGIRLHSDEFARYAVRPQGLPTRVLAGERYRVSVWVKLEDDARIETDTPGVALRATLFSGPNSDFPGGHLFIGTNGVSRGTPAGLAAPRLGTWTKIEGVIQIPAGVREMMPFVFCWRTTGTIEIDSPSVTKVGADASLSSIVGASLSR